MNGIGHLRFLLLLAFLTLGIAGQAESQGQNQGNGRLKAEFDEELTPLQGAIADIVAERKGNNKAHPALTLKCANPNSNNPKCSELDKPCKDCGELKNGNGRTVGRRNRTETIVEYGNPGQRKQDAARFDRIKVGNRQSDGFGAGPGKSWKKLELPAGRDDLQGVSNRDAAASVAGLAGGANPVRARVRSAQSGLAVAINNDQDCIDTVSGEWFQGPACFDSDSGELLTNLVELEFDGLVTGCEHVETGQQFTQDPEGADDGICFDEGGNFKQTSLEELIDEDGPDFAENPIDQDGDGFFDEDPSESGDIVATCRAFYESEGLDFDETGDVADGQCDMTRAFMVKLNRKAKQMAEAQEKSIEYAYAVDEQGRPIDETKKNEPEFKKAKNYGEHARKVKIREEFTIRCKGNEELIDDECVGRVQNNGKLAQFAFAKAMAEDASSFDRVQKSPMLMGFTFAPPVVEWGYKIEEEVCVDLLVGTVCAEVFFARIGYEFDIAAGLRLPIEVQLTELPPTGDPGALAQTNPIIRTSLEPKDFTVGDFRAICLDNNLSSDCTRFAFPEFLDSFNPFKSEAAKDGSELVARETIFAGIQVRTLGIPLINWAVDSDVDLMAMCTMLQIQAAAEGTTLLEMAQIGSGLAEGDTTALLDKLKESNCASFTTPFGFDEEGDLRTFPFTQGFDIRADCAEALVRGEVINIKGKPRPICTGLILGAQGASLGVGLGIEASLGSTRIDAEWKVEGDSVGSDGDRKLIYRHEPGDEADVLDIPLTADNYQNGNFKDSARVELDDFVYLLNTINLALSARLEFGGILSPIPDIASFKLFDLVLSGDDIGIPIGQHAGMDPIQAAFFVRNYALEVDGEPAAATPPARVDDDTLLIKPGEIGTYQVRVTNRGSVDGSFDNFRAVLSNQPDQGGAPYSFVINPNTDLDCIDGEDNHFFGNPYDGIADDCYTSGGGVRSDRDELIDEDGPGPEGDLAADRDDDGDGLADEDPAEEWLAAFPVTSAIAGVGPYTESTESRSLNVTPFRHPLTAPGLYPVQVLADSVEAKSNTLMATDPVGQSRVDAKDVVFIKVDAFYDPLIVAQALLEAGKPGVGKGYTVEVSNGANVDDTIEVATKLVDFNQAGCTLTTLGDDEELCPFRATPTAVLLDWTNGFLPTPTASLEPLQVASNPFTIGVPPDWAGMEDTTYQVTFTATSTGDPAASNEVKIGQTVIATMESMTRYIGLELEELIAVLDQAEADGVATAGLKPISIQAVQRTNNRALDSILAGNLDRAARTHAANIRIVEGFVRALAGSGKDLPVALFDDLNARAAAILEDLAKAEVSLIPSA